MLAAHQRAKPQPPARITAPADASAPTGSACWRAVILADCLARGATRSLKVERGCDRSTLGEHAAPREGVEALS